MSTTAQHTPGPWSIKEILTLRGKEFSISNEDLGLHVGILNYRSDAELVILAPETAAERDRLKDVLRAMNNYVSMREFDTIDRIKAENNQLSIIVGDLTRKVDKLKSLNAELVEALEQSRKELIEFRDYWQTEADSFDSPSMKQERKLCKGRSSDIQLVIDNIKSLLQKAKDL